MTVLKKGSCVVLGLWSAGALFGCSHYEVNTGRGNVAGYYIRQEMQEADRAVEAARQAGKDKSCPEEFKEAERAKDNAYDIFRACHSEEGAGLAKQASAKANALCPAKAAVPPTDTLTVAPASIAKGEAATLSAIPVSVVEQPAAAPVQTIEQPAAAPVQAIEQPAAAPVQAIAQPAAAPVLAVEKPAAASVPVVKGCKQTVLNIRFALNKYNVQHKYHNELKRLADFMKEFPKAKGVIEGHTDNLGKVAANMKLSQRRADSVRSYLIKYFAIAPGRLTAKGYGPTRPISTNKGSAGKAKNRRIEANFTCE